MGRVMTMIIICVMRRVGQGFGTGMSTAIRCPLQGGCSDLELLQCTRACALIAKGNRHPPCCGLIEACAARGPQLCAHGHRRHPGCRLWNYPARIRVRTPVACVGPGRSPTGEQAGPGGAVREAVAGYASASTAQPRFNHRRRPWQYRPCASHVRCQYRKYEKGQAAVI